MKNSSPSKQQSPEYFATSIKKVIILSFLTLGWYNLRWYITNFHRYVMKKTRVKSPVNRAILATVMYFASIFTFLFLAYDIKAQAKEKQIKR